MAPIIPLDEGLAVAPQIAPEDVAAIAAAGFGVILCNRPDDEEPGQPAAADIAALAQEAGLAFHHLPIDARGIGPAHLDAMASIVAEGGRVLAYCRSGTRSSMLWALHSAATTPPDAVIAAAARGGYQLDALRPALEARHAAARRGD